jgi:hypothetical protein
MKVVWNRRAAAAWVVALLGGCYAGKSVHMGKVPAESAHYVVVKTKWTGAMVIYDCVSRPNGAWEPTCHQTKMVSAAEAALSGAVQRIRTKGEAPEAE